ncbi:MAG: methyl-accepting chemotaxis protein [Candidatus Omnitrophota bacterium]|nr:methyl-accepting chemotaxis protein [Candidatus Omnitrophota bacterium]
MHRRTHYLIKSKFQLKYTLAIVAMLLAVMIVSGAGLYIGMWSSIIENFSQFKVSENLETAKRIAGYEEARYKKGDFRLEKIFREAELLSAREQETLHNALNSVNRSLIPKVMILAVVIFVAGILISHRIAGPMYRFEKSAEGLRSGNLNVKFNVRKSDEMKDTAALLEQMVESLHKDIAEVKELATKGDTIKISEILSKYKI